jgi:hypothetical protein
MQSYKIFLSKALSGDLVSWEEQKEGQTACILDEGYRRLPMFRH